jgi:outer membrane protein assembly factor BamB
MSGCCTLACCGQLLIEFNLNGVMAKSFLTTLVLLLGTAAGYSQSDGKGWTVEFKDIGVHSSPRVADLNQDGVKDIIIGCGKKEFERTSTGMMAVDGATGKLLWRVPARDQIFGSAALLDINRDGVPDVIIGGRAAELKAINGKTGKVIWEFYASFDSMQPRKKGWFNFYNPQVIPDQNQDGIEDILVANGGDILVAAYDPNRPPGKLMVLDGSNGKILAQAQVPDGRETYMSMVVAHLHPDDPNLSIIFGTGGETVGGSLYRTTLQDLMRQDISKAHKLASSKDKGFISPPVLCDLNGDGYLDIVANAVEGKMLAFDGRNNSLLWERKMENTEAYASIGVGYFNSSQTPGLFTLFTEGVWPQLDATKQLMLDGRTGEIAFQDSLGILQTSSPVVADFNNDGHDDGLVHINFIVVENVIFQTYYNMLVVYDFFRNSTYQLTDPVPGINLSSTPWVGDLDGDGKLDVIYCYLTNSKKDTAMDGFKMVRLPLPVEMKKPVRWGSYMGSHYDGIFK